MAPTARAKKVQMTSSTPRTQWDTPHPSIRSYMPTPIVLRTQGETSNMVPSSPSTLSEDGSHTDISMPTASTPDWYALFVSLPKKEDIHSLLEEVKSALHTEMCSLTTSLIALEARVTALESRGPSQQGPILPCPAL
ncbi:Hypothetical predicted protein [Pelobates cultripes]|uniref:Uncharacterized protein n=1 Tax=Pelobates cultripes TaxID=61616 RepID=A0AAD1SHU8_PELCU|nr:Hypothetical predicted protein [Pelobates cultripes]